MNNSQAARLTLVEVTEMFDKVTEIRMEICHACQRLNKGNPSGDKSHRLAKFFELTDYKVLSIARARELIKKYKDWVFHYSIKTDEERDVARISLAQNIVFHGF